jgi:hypothetical protein
MANKKNLDELLDELQDKVGSLYGGMHELDDEGKKRREENIMQGLAKVREYLGPEGMKKVEEEVNELEPKVQVIQPRQLGSFEPVPDVKMSDLERYHILKKLLNS